MSGLEKFKKDLPWKEKLYSSLTSKNIIDKGYDYVLNVWNKSEMKTMKNYHDLYLKCDVLSLTDAFEKFMNNSLKNYVLCSSHYLSASGLTLDTMLKQKASLNLFQILACTYSLEKAQEMKFLIFLMDTAKSSINISSFMT